jgi:hypothetical protein
VAQAAVARSRRRRPRSGSARVRPTWIRLSP